MWAGGFTWGEGDCGWLEELFVVCVNVQGLVSHIQTQENLVLAVC